MTIYGDTPINPPARRFTSKELDGALDDIIEGRINFNAPVRGPNNSSAKNFRPASGNTSWQRMNGSRSGQPILDDALELPNAPNTPPASNVRPASGRIPRQRTYNPRSAQPIIEDVLELPDAPNTQSTSSVRPAAGGMPRQRSKNPRSYRPIVEDVLELPDAPRAIPLGQSPWTPTPAHPPAHISYGNFDRALDKIIDGPQRSVPYIRPAPRSGPSLFGQGSSMVEAPPFQLKGPNETITQPRSDALTNGRPGFGAPNDRPTQGHDSAMAGAPPASFSKPRDRNDQLRMPVPTGLMLDVRPAPSFIPASAPRSGPAFPHGIANQPEMPVPTGPRSDVRPAASFLPASAPRSGPGFPPGIANQPGMPIPTGPRSNMSHVINNQPRVSVPTASASQVYPAPPPHLAATPSGSASPQASLSQARMPVPTAPTSDIFQAPRPLPASVAPSSPASLDPRRRPGFEPRALSIGSAHLLTPDSRCQSSSSVFHDSVTVEAPSRPTSIAQQRRPGHEPVSVLNSSSAHNLSPDSERQSSSSTFPNSARINDHSVDRELDETRTASMPEGAASTRSPQSHPAQFFAQSPPAQAAPASQKGPHSSLSSSQSIQTPGLSSAADSAQASLSQSQRGFKIIRMRMVENAVTVRSGYALFWV